MNISNEKLDRINRIKEIEKDIEWLGREIRIMREYLENTSEDDKWFKEKFGWIIRKSCKLCGKIRKGLDGL